MIKPSSYIFGWEQDVKNCFLNEGFQSIASFDPKFYQLTNYGIQKMKLFHSHGYKYIREMNGPSEIFLLKKSADEIGNIKKEVRQKLKGEALKKGEVIWFDGKLIFWNSICLNFVHTSDNPSEASMNYSVAYPEYQVMTRFMYPNLVLEKKMKEYEYSIKVKSIKPYIDYCKKNHYELEDVTKQNRIVYENKYSEDIIARITTSVKQGKKTCIFDCKNVGVRNEALKISSESIPLKVTKGNRQQVESILQVLNFYEAANNNRIRYIYKKDDIKFEIDDYTSPVMCVVGIEGKGKKVDKVYEEIKGLENV